MPPPLQVLLLVLKIGRSDKELEDQKTTWLALIKRVRKVCQELPKTHKKRLPLCLLDATLTQIETTILAFPDPTLAQKAAVAGLKAVGSILKSIATLKVDDGLWDHLCTGINMAAGLLVCILLRVGFGVSGAHGGARWSYPKDATSFG